MALRQVPSAPAASRQSGGLSAILSKVADLPSMAASAIAKATPYAAWLGDLGWAVASSAVLLAIPIVVEIQRETTVRVMQKQREMETQQIQVRCLRGDKHYSVPRAALSTFAIRCLLSLCRTAGANTSEPGGSPANSPRPGLSAVRRGECSKHHSIGQSSTFLNVRLVVCKHTTRSSRGSPAPADVCYPGIDRYAAPPRESSHLRIGPSTERSRNSKQRACLEPHPFAHEEGRRCSGGARTARS